MDRLIQLGGEATIQAFCKRVATCLTDGVGIEWLRLRIKLVDVARWLHYSPDMNTTTARFSKATRVQTTVSILEEAIAGVDALAVDSGVSRSRLMDLAVRRFLRWAANLDPQDLQLIAEYEVTEPISGFVRRPSGTMSAPPPPESQPEVEAPRAKVLSSSAPASYSPDEVGPITPRRGVRVPVEEPPPRVRDRQGRYSETPGRGRK